MNIKKTLIINDDVGFDSATVGYIQYFIYNYTDIEIRDLLRKWYKQIKQLNYPLVFEVLIESEENIPANLDSLGASEITPPKRLKLYRRECFDLIYIGRVYIYFSQ